MVMGEKDKRKIPDRTIKKVLDKNDPFDQLIMQLARKGILDVCVVGIGQELAATTEHPYSRKPLLFRGKHSS
jgi:hypothetical protein